MAGSINKVILVGRLGKDPEMRFTPSGKAVTNFTMATSETWTQDGEKKEQTEWHKVVIWGKLAEVAAKYLAKGSQVYIEGKLQTRKWDDANGIERYTTEIVASHMTLLGKGSSSERLDSSEHSGSEHTGGYDDDSIPF